MMSRLALALTIVGAILLSLPVFIGFGVQSQVIAALEEMESDANEFLELTDVSLKSYDRGLFRSHADILVFVRLPGGATRSLSIPVRADIAHGPLLIHRDGVPSLGWALARTEISLATVADLINANPDAVQAIWAATEQSTGPLVFVLDLMSQGGASQDERASRILGVTGQILGSLPELVLRPSGAAPITDHQSRTSGHWLSANPKLDAEVVVDFDYAGKVSINLPRIELTDPRGLTVTWDGGTQSGTFTNGFASHESQVNLGALRLCVDEAWNADAPLPAPDTAAPFVCPPAGSSEYALLTTAGAHGTSRYVEVDGATQAQNDLTVRDVRFEVRRDGFTTLSVSIPTVTNSFASTLKAGTAPEGYRIGDMKDRYEIPRIEIVGDDTSAQTWGLTLGYSMRNLDLGAAARLWALAAEAGSGDQNTTSASEEAPDPRVMEEVGLLATSSPVFSLDELVVRVGDESAIMHGQLAVEGFDAEAFRKDPESLTAALRIAADVAIDVPLGRDWAKWITLAQMESKAKPPEAGSAPDTENPLATMTPAQREATAAMAADFALLGATAQGQVLIEDGRYRSRFAFDGERATLNDKPLQ